jgi:hypothetical protein
MNIFLGQPLPTEANTKIVNKANISTPYMKIQGKTFTYYVKTDPNGNV